ncbi:MAG TPA: response regulator transcription factor [Solirubrobacteraceae bacterium]|nr:response regulator transcription factor [Solirubrobacteraceae bacterium]
MAVPLVTSVLLADDHAMVRAGLARILDAEPDLRVVAEAEDGRAATDRVLAGGVDLAILDVVMPRMTGLQAAREITARRPQVRVLMLSMHDNEQYFFQALRAGASGYVLKTAAERDLVAACRAAVRGEPFLFPGAVKAVVRDYLERAADGDEADADPLSPRETEVVKLIGEGHSTREIADALVIAEKTVDRHRSRIFEKLGLHDRVALTRWAIRRGLVEP